MAELNRLIESLKVAMYLTGCQTCDDLAKRPLLIEGRLRQHLEALGMDYRALVRQWPAAKP